jgi:hypothetical protein
VTPQYPSAASAQNVLNDPHQWCIWINHHAVVRHVFFCLMQAYGEFRFFRNAFGREELANT